MIRLEITEHDTAGDCTLGAKATLILLERNVPAESINLPAILAAFTKQKRASRAKKEAAKP